MSAEIRVLILNDNETEAAYCNSRLTGANDAFKLLAVTSASEVLPVCERFSPDCLILDDRFDGAGLCFLDHIGDTVHGLAYPVVMMTGDAGARIAAEARRLGVQECLSRGSSSPSQLVQAVMRAMKKHSERTDRTRQPEARMRFNDLRFRALTEMVPCTVWTARPDGFIDSCGAQLANYSGWTPDGGNGAGPNGAGWMDALHPDDLTRAAQEWIEALETEQPFEQQYQFRRADGAYRWFRIRAVLLRDEKGAPTQWLGTCTDIDDSLSLNLQLAFLSDQLSRSNHDIRSLACAVDTDRVNSAQMMLH